MSKHLGNSFANNDEEAREALWMAICDAASKLAGCCRIYMSRSSALGTHISAAMPVPEVHTWRLVEGLSLLAILVRADEVKTREVTNLFGRTGPVRFMEDGRSWYLWAQPTLSGQQSGLGGRPDLLVTSSPDVPSASTVSRVVECKCHRRLGARDIRAEFGKAHDLRVTSYVIWSFTTPSAHVVEGARRLGLDLEILGFDTARRPDLIAMPESLVAHVANTLEVSKREKRFAQALIKTGQDISRKMLEA